MGKTFSQAGVSQKENRTEVNGKSTPDLEQDLRIIEVKI